jgi:predicted Fe-Mo cluster-binding NifX family protein
MIKIAIPTRAGEVDQHFGHCEAFTIVTFDDNKTLTASEQYTPPPACGCKSNLIPTLVDMGITVIVAGNMGEGATQRLRQAGMKVLRGASGPVAEAAQAWAEGKIKDQDILCMAHGADHDCQHGH